MTARCDSDDCERPVCARGLCSAHYQQATARGELHLHPLAVRAPLIDRTVGKDCPTDHKHGKTSTCYSAHGCRCAECRKSKSVERNLYDWETRRRTGRDVWVPATGTMRRLQALAVIGWSTAEIAKRIDSHYRPLQKIRAGQRECVRSSTARRVAVVYESLSMRVRHDRAARITHFRAVANGWVPPLAWDDIDRDRRSRVRRAAA